MNSVAEFGGEDGVDDGESQDDDEDHPEELIPDRWCTFDSDDPEIKISYLRTIEQT